MSRLENVDGALWLAEGEIVRFYGFPYPTRGAIARLADGGLWVWSPVKLDAALRHEVDRLGRVAHLVSPNKLHHLYHRPIRKRNCGVPNRPLDDATISHSPGS